MKEIMELEQLIDERYKKIDKAELLLDQLKEQQRQLHEAHTFQCMKLNRLATEFSDSAIASKYCDGMHQMVDGAEYKEIHQSIDRGMITLKQKIYDYFEEIEYAKSNIVCQENRVKKLQQEAKQLSITGEA